jgi:hypothetical protein
MMPEELDKLKSMIEQNNKIIQKGEEILKLIQTHEANLERLKERVSQLEMRLSDRERYWVPTYYSPYPFWYPFPDTYPNITCSGGTYFHGP